MNQPLHIVMTPTRNEAPFFLTFLFAYVIFLLYLCTLLALCSMRLV